MAAPVRIEAMAFSDPRFEALGQLGGYNAHEARGRMALLWSFCTERGTDVVSPAIVRACLAVGATEIKEAELGDIVDGGVRVRGADEERIGWYLPELERRKTAQRAGKARAANAPRDANGRLLSSESTSGPPADHQRTTSGPPADHQRSPASPSPSLSPEEKKTHTAGAHARSAGAGPPSPSLGLADRIWTDQAQRVGALVARFKLSLPPGAGLMGDAKRKLLARIAELVESDDLGVAEKACRHVLDVTMADCERDKTVRYANGGQWDPDRFADAMTREVGSPFRPPPKPGNGRFPAPAEPPLYREE